MKKTFLLTATALVLLLASCQKEGTVSDRNSQSEELVFTASVPQSYTKTTVNTDASSTDRGTVSWEVNDEISISDGTGTAVYTIKSSDDIAADGTASFSYKSGKISTTAESYTATYGGEVAAVQSYSAVAGKLPMSGVSDSEDKTKLHFTVTCGLMKLNLTASSSNETDRTISMITVSGASVDGTRVAYSLSCEDESIDTAKDFFIALPAGSYSLMKFVNGTGNVCYRTAKTAVEIVNNKIQPVTVKGLAFEDTLPGIFNVGVADESTGYTGKVRFSKGNLQAAIDASGNPQSWNFALNQYDYIGNATANNSIGTAAGKVDLFGWSTSGTQYGINTSTSCDDYSGDFVDWGNAIEGNKWRTLTGGPDGEWKYLLTNSKNKRFTLTLNNGTTVFGLVIAPSDYSGPWSDSASSISWADWQFMESSGCVFLPAAGMRQGSGVYYSNAFVGYWSSICEDDEITYSILYTNGILDDDDMDMTSAETERSGGLAVRLVSDVK